MTCYDCGLATEKPYAIWRWQSGKPAKNYCWLCWSKLNEQCFKGAVNRRHSPWLPLLGILVSFKIPGGFYIMGACLLWLTSIAADDEHGFVTFNTDSHRRTLAWTLLAIMAAAFVAAIIWDFFTILS
jgi:hypothetical protein